MPKEPKSERKEKKRKKSEKRKREAAEKREKSKTNLMRWLPIYYLFNGKVQKTFNVLCNTCKLFAAPAFQFSRISSLKLN